MASYASSLFTLFVCACVYTEVKCDSTCSNMLECTMYNIQQVGSKVDSIQSNMAAIANQLSQIQVQIATDKEEMQQQVATDKEEMQQQMETEREEMQQDIATQNEEIASQKAEITRQKEELQNLTVKLESQLKEMKWQMAIEREEMQQQMATERDEMQQDIANQTEELVCLKDDVASQKSELQNLSLKLGKTSDQEKEELSSYVSFTAYATKKRGYNFRDHVMFDSTLRNYGSAYYANVSEFVCPVNAYYMISISLLADKWMYARIMLDNEKLVVAYAHDDGVKPSASQTMVTYCAAGQRIWVKCIANNKVMYGHFDWFYSTFGVTLLRIA